MWRLLYCIVIVITLVKSMCNLCLVFKLCIFCKLKKHVGSSECHALNMEVLKPRSGELLCHARAYCFKAMSGNNIKIKGLLKFWWFTSSLSLDEVAYLWHSLWNHQIYQVIFQNQNCSYLVVLSLALKITLAFALCGKDLHQIAIHMCVRISGIAASFLWSKIQNLFQWWKQQPARTGGLLTQPDHSEEIPACFMT